MTMKEISSLTCQDSKRKLHLCQNNSFDSGQTPGGGGGGTQMLFGRGCEAEASKPVPIFKGHFGRKGTHY